MSFSLSSWAEARRAPFEARLAELLEPVFPPPFQEACRYPLGTGGKRMRPLLCFAAAEAAGGAWADALTPALAVELVHTFSLVHDDLPCMDDDQLRRGRPTVHVRYGEAAALLVGDTLLAEAFALLGADPVGARCVRDLAEATRTMCAGQYLDIYAAPADLDALTALHRAKTGALITAAVRMGGRSVGASPATLAALGACGEAIGLAFQVHDDVLDAHQASDPGGAPNFVRLLGLEGTRAYARRLATEAEAALAGLPNAEALVALARYAVDRDH